MTLKKKRFGRFVSCCVLACLSLFITMVVAVGAVYTYMELQLPDVAVLRDVHMQIPLRVYTSDGKLISEFGSMKRIPVPLKQVPKRLIQAVLAVEDARFYEHPGVDFIGLVRAAKAVVSSGRKVEGASTITMQVARNFFLTKRKTYSRKTKEILLALKIDKEFSKDKILELYLNKVYFGNRAYGVAAAAQVYYGKKLNELTLPQMAMLAGLPQAPSRDNPLRNPQRALVRRNHVLKRMLEVKFINKRIYEKAIQAPLTEQYHELRVQVDAPYVAEMVRQVMVSEYGADAYDRGFAVVTTLSSRLQEDAAQALEDGLIAYTERHGYRKPSQNLGWPSKAKRPRWEAELRQLDHINLLHPAAVLSTQGQSAQVLLDNGSVMTLPWSAMSWAHPAYHDGFAGPAPQSAHDIMKPGDVIWIIETKDGWHLSQIPHVQGAIVSVNPYDGAIVALSGGFNYGLSNFNRVTQAMRQPGSVFKPFLYSAALAKGFTLASIINDAPIVVHDSGENELWRPNNDTLRFYGPTRLRIGLIHSRNIVSIRLLQAMGIPYARSYVERFGFDAVSLPKELSLALGTGVATPMQIASAYAIFANGGYQVQPYFIQKIVDENGGAILFKANPPKACRTCLAQTQGAAPMSNSIAKRVITPQNDYLMTKAMQDVIQNGTATAAKVLGRADLAGKTGTTNDKVDAWFSGFNSTLVTTVWVGFDNSTPMHEYGNQAALPIWIQFMRVALAGTPEQTMAEPPDIVTMRIDPRSGLLAAPNQNNAVFEVFEKDHQPVKVASSSTNNNIGAPSAVAVSHNGGGSSSGSSSAGDEGGSGEPLF